MSTTAFIPFRFLAQTPLFSVSPCQSPSLPLIIRIAMRAIRCKYSRKMTKGRGGAPSVDLYCGREGGAIRI